MGHNKVGVFIPSNTYSLIFTIQGKGYHGNTHYPPDMAQANRELTCPTKTTSGFFHKGSPDT